MKTNTDTHINTHEFTDPTFPVYPCEYELVPCPLYKKYPPRSFQGYEPLAYVRDILTLQRRVVRWLTGDDSQSAIIQLIDTSGFIPLNSSGLIPTKYYGMNTLYNTTTVNSKANTYNFFGKNVKVTQSEEDTEKVNIEIKQLKCASNLGTTDGTTDGHLYYSNDLSSNMVTGQLPDFWTVEPTLNFGDWVNRQTVDIFKYTPSTIILENTDYINFACSTTFFVIAVKTPDAEYTVQSELISGNTENAILAGMNQNIKLSITDWTDDDGDTFKAKIHISVNANNLFKNENYPLTVKPTRFQILIAHHNYDAVSFATYTDWENWLSADDEITKYVKKNIFACSTKHYLYSTPYQITAENFWYELSNLNTFNTTGIDQIYSGNITFHIDNISNLYNLASIINKVQFNSNLIKETYIISDEDLYPESAFFNTQAKINWFKTFTITSGIYSPSTLLTANFIISNSTSDLISTAIISSFETPINTLINTNYSSDIAEYFFDKEITATKFGEKYRILDHTPSIISSDLQVIPGSGLVYSGLNSENSYIREFNFNQSINNPTFIFTGITSLNNINLYYENNNEWANLATIITNIKFVDNSLYIQLNYSSPTIKIKITANKDFGIISSIKTYTYKNSDLIQTLNNIMFDINIIKNKLNL